MRLFSATAICAAVLASTPALALHCYELALKDGNGAILRVSPPAIGLMIGGNPVIEGNYPAHVTREPVAPAQCPVSLVENVRVAFNASCPGEELRNKAAEANKVPRDVIDRGCNDMAAALQNKDVEYYEKRDELLFPKDQGPKKPDVFPKKPGEK